MCFSIFSASFIVSPVEDLKVCVFKKFSMIHPGSGH